MTNKNHLTNSKLFLILTALIFAVTASFKTSASEGEEGAAAFEEPGAQVEETSGDLTSIAETASYSSVSQSSNSMFEEIIVTAEKRSESLQDISQAVTVLSGEDLDNRQISTFVDISAIAPGVNVAKNEGFKTVITIRGVGYETNQNAIATPSVSYHLDGIYVASPYSLQTDFLDLERVEVLRGPQGTLFGQNST